MTRDSKPPTVRAPIPRGLPRGGSSEAPKGRSTVSPPGAAPAGYGSSRGEASRPRPPAVAFGSAGRRTNPARSPRRSATQTPGVRFGSALVRICAATAGASFVAATAGGAFIAATAAGQSRTAWEGVYTEAQAARGRERYRALCGYCHRDDLSGGGSEAGAPALRGPFFVNQWRDRPLVDLFVTIGTTMPQQNPDSLRAQVVIDVVSYLLQQNGMPAGEHELPPRLDPLRGIVLGRPPGR